MSLSAGTFLANRYKIVSRLGAGGMGEVYRATDLRLGRDVAIKVLPEHLASSSEALSRFEREAKAIAALSHTNILAIHDFVIDQNVSFAVMELLEGETLARLIQKSAIAWRRATDIAIAIAEGLAAAHSKGIIHRDLKPENVFITSDGQVKILDFGLARLETTVPSTEQSSAPTMSQTRPGVVMGTIPYMSPEQVRGETLDSRSDIFSFGCVIYEMLTGTRAFERKSIGETFSAILNEEPPDVSTFKKDLPTELTYLIHHCLEKNPERRIQSVRDISIQLVSITNQSSKRVMTSRMLLFPNQRTYLVGAILLLILVGSYLYLAVPKKPVAKTTDPTIRSLAVIPFTNVGNDEGSEYLSDGITESLINSLSQLPNIRVLSRESVFGYKNKEAKSEIVGRDLGVEALVRGRVVQRGDGLVVNATLVRTEDGTQVWGQSYNRKLADVLVLQEIISKEIATNLKLKLTGEQEKRLTKQYTENPEAYQLYLRGMHHWWKNTNEDYARAKDYFEQAIELDPAYALAYIGLGDYYFASTINGFIAPKEAWPKAQAAYRQALKIDDNLALANRGLALYEFEFKWNWNEADRKFKRAVEIDPDNPIPHYSYSWFLMCMGQSDRALAEVRKAQELDPLSRVFNLLLGQYLFRTGHYDEAIQQLQKTIDLHPEYGVAYLSLADVYEQKGMYNEAISYSEKGCRLLSDDEAAEIYSEAIGKEGYLKAGNKIRLRKLEDLKNFAKVGYVSPMEFAVLHAQLNNKDEALRWLEKAYEEHSGQLVFLKVKTEWNNLRADPRFTDLIRRVGLP